MKVLSRKGASFNVELETGEPYVYSNQILVTPEGYRFWIEDAHSKGIVLVALDDGVVILDGSNFIVTDKDCYPTCCSTGRCYSWTWPGRSPKWGGPDRPGWCSHAGTTGGGWIWNIDNCETCGAPMPPDPPWAKIIYRRLLLRTLRTRSEFESVQRGIR